jgi:hypothetical protein
MKYVSYNVDNNCIEVYNSISGVETIKVNNEEVSKKFSFLETNHCVQINNQFYTLKSGIDFFGSSFKLFSEGKALELPNLISKKEKYTILFKRITFFVLGVVLGLVFGKALDLVFNLF